MALLFTRCRCANLLKWNILVTYCKSGNLSQPLATEVSSSFNPYLTTVGIFPFLFARYLQDNLCVCVCVKNIQYVCHLSDCELDLFYSRIFTHVKYWQLELAHSRNFSTSCKCHLSTTTACSDPDRRSS